MDKARKVSKVTNKNECEIIISLPASLSEEFNASKPFNVSLKHIDRIRWHISMEHGPDLSLQGVTLTKECNQACHFRNRLSQFSIDMFLVQFQGEFRYSEMNITFLSHEDIKLKQDAHKTQYQPKKLEL